MEISGIITDIPEDLSKLTMQGEVMSLSEDLSSALKEAMKAKDKPRLDAIRQIQTEVAKKKAEKV